MGLLVLTGGLFPGLAQNLTATAANAWVTLISPHSP